MSVEIDYLDSDSLNLERWLQNERVLTYQKAAEEKLIEFLLKEDDLQIFQMLSLIGCSAEQSPLLQKEIWELNAAEDLEIIPCGLRKSISKTKRFLAKHKAEILAGIVLCVTGVGAAAATGYTCSVALGGVVVAGAGSIFSGAKELERKLPPPPASQSEIALYQQSLASKLPKLELPPESDGLLLTSNGIWTNGQFFSYQDLQTNLPASHISSHSLQAPNESFASNQPFPDQTLPLPKAPPRNEFLPKNETLTQAPFPSQENTAPLKPYYKENSHQDVASKNLSNETQPRTSTRFSIEGQSDKNLQINWINGVWNTFADSKDNARYIQNLANGFTVCGIYNCTHGKVADIAEAGIFNHNGFSPNTALLLQADWTAFHEANQNRPNAKLLQICHSQGAIHVRNALRDTPAEIRDRIIVLAIAPGAVVPNRLCFESYNYASERDSIYKFEPSDIPVTSLTLDDVLIPTFGEPINDRDELIILSPHPEAPSFDHPFQSPTYKEVIKKTIESYQTCNGEYLPTEKVNQK